MRRRMTTIITTTTGLALGLALGLATPSLAATAGADAAGAGGSAAPALCQAVDFQKAQVTPLATTGAAASVRYRLTVSGQVPASNVRVTLVPAVYLQQPDFWQITVTGCSTDVGLPVLTPYKVSYDFTGTLGRCGVEAVGATTRQQFDLAGCLPGPLPGTR